MANQLVQRLTNKVGPLPAWAWAAIPATAYVAWSYYRASQGDSVIADDTGEPAYDNPVDEYGINAGGASLPGYGSAPGGSSNLPPVETPKPTNTDWFRRASSYLIGQNYTATDVVTALNAYIFGSPATVNPTQLRALNAAIAALGPAPDPAFIPPVTPTPTPAPTPTPTPTPKPTVPGAVTQLSATSPSTNRLAASWRPPSGRVTRYKWIVYDGTKAVKSGETVATSTAVAVTGKRIYAIRVWPINERGTGAVASATVTVK